MAHGAGVPAASAAKGKSAQVWRVGWRCHSVGCMLCLGITHKFLERRNLFGKLTTTKTEEELWGDKASAVFLAEDCGFVQPRLM